VGGVERANGDVYTSVGSLVAVVFKFWHDNMELRAPGATYRLVFEKAMWFRVRKAV
jgi:hypothetical protein